jgi:hypothetical protein
MTFANGFVEISAVIFSVGEGNRCNMNGTLCDGSRSLARWSQYYGIQFGKINGMNAICFDQLGVWEMQYRR